MDEAFEMNPIKRGGKIPLNQPRNHSKFQQTQTISFNNNYATAPTSPNPYIFRKINNMDQAVVMKREREDWIRLYHKMLKGLETMINVQRMTKDIKKLAEEANTVLTEMEGTILMVSITNRTMNATNLTQILEDLRYLVHSDMDKKVFQIQQMLADELDQYKEKDNKYVEDNIKEIQELYMNEEIKQAQGTIENEEIILVQPYQMESTTTSSSTSSFISDEIDNLEKYMKFVKTPS